MRYDMGGSSRSKSGGSVPNASVAVQQRYLRGMQDIRNQFPNADPSWLALFAPTQQDLQSQGRGQNPNDILARLAGGADPNTGLAAIPVPTDKTATVADAVKANPNDVAAQQLAALANQLFGQTNLAVTDPSADIAAAIKGINQQYGGQIQGLNRANANAKAEANFGSKQTQKLYRALARSMKRDANQETRSSGNLAKQLNALGAGVATAAVAQNAKQEAQNVAEAKALGQPAMAQALNAALQNQSSHQASVARAEGQASAADQLKLGGIYSRGAREEGRAGRIEGTQRAADLYAQLQDYVQGNLDKIASLRGEAASAKAQARASLSQNYTDALNAASQKNAENYWQAMLDIANQKTTQNKAATDKWYKTQELNIARQKLNQSTSTSNNPFPKSLTNANSIIDQYPAINNAYTTIMNSDAAVGGKVDLTSPAQVMHLIQTSGAGKGLSATEQQALMAAIIQANS